VEYSKIICKENQVILTQTRVMKKDMREMIMLSINILINLKVVLIMDLENMNLSNILLKFKNQSRAIY
jgi:predicted nucleic acid-binding Zn ribbon protein